MARASETTAAAVADGAEDGPLLGHDGAAREVLDAWQAGRFPHAWLVHGPRGVGKAGFALRLSQFILCGGGEDSGHGAGEAMASQPVMAGQGACARRVAGGAHADFMLLERGEQSVIATEQVRRAIRFARLTPAEARWKILLLDSVDDLNVNGANALLKIVEEPPGNALILLLAHGFGQVPATLRSRCRGLRLEALSDGVMGDLIGRYLPELDGEARRRLIALSGGSIGRALAYERAGGVALFDAMTALLSHMGARGGPDMTALSDLAEHVSGRDKEAHFQVLRDLLDWWFKRLIAARARGGTPAALSEADGRALAAFSSVGNLEKLLQLWDKTTALLQQADRPAWLDKKQLVFSAFMTIKGTMGVG